MCFVTRVKLFNNWILPAVSGQDWLKKDSELGEPRVRNTALLRVRMGFLEERTFEMGFEG